MFRYLLILSLFALAAVSCKRRACISYGVQGISISSPGGGNIPDTAVKVVRFLKNGSVPVDSFQQHYDYYPVNTLMVLFDTSSFANYDYDMICTLYPSGKTFQVTNLTHENGKSDKPGFSCVNPVHYSVNGQATSMPGYRGMQGFVLNVDYK